MEERARLFVQKHGRKPGLGVLLVGDDAASHVYVNNKMRAAEGAGFYSRTDRLAASSSTDDVLCAVDALNDDPNIDGFIVQLPLPSQVNTQAVLLRIDVKKDADGLHPTNLGAVLMGQGGVQPCTPRGCMRLLAETGIALRGKKAVVIGRSHIVGRPIAAMLLDADATVTLCHSRTQDLATEVAMADVVIAAVGRPGLVRGEWLKPGAIVIDVGINRVGDKLCGDVDFESASQRASFITPVPGGVGPMTIAMLLQNTLELGESKAP